MEKILLGVMALLLGALGIVLFGKAKGNKEALPPPIEQVESPPAPVFEPAALADEAAAESSVVASAIDPTSAPVLPDGAASAPSSSEAVPVDEAIADPWAVSGEPKGTDDRGDNAAVSPVTAAGEMAADPLPIVSPVSEDDVSPAQRAAALSDQAAPVAPSMPPFAAIHDPKRPSTPLLQDLSQEIMAMGTSQKLSYVPKLLQYRQYDDPMIRCYVVHALGQIAAAHTVKSEIQSVIPFLGELADDKDAEVRKMAFKALSRIQSPDVLPYLEKGLVSTSGPVKQLAHEAIKKLKLQYSAAPPDEFPPALQQPPG